MLFYRNRDPTRGSHEVVRPDVFASHGDYPGQVRGTISIGFFALAIQTAGRKGRRSSVREVSVAQIRFDRLPGTHCEPN